MPNAWATLLYIHTVYVSIVPACFPSRPALTDMTAVAGIACPTAALTSHRVTALTLRSWDTYTVPT